MKLTCYFLNRKGHCTKSRQECKLQSLLSNGNGHDKKELEKTFLYCYLENLKQDKKIGHLFFRANMNQIFGKRIKPLTEYETQVILDIVEDRKSKLNCMFRIPEPVKRFSKLFS